jgi:hypothetical protein
MIVLIHVLAALVSLIFTSYTYIFPAQNKIRASYGLVALTLGSGTYLVVSTKSNMLKACLTGLIYLAIVLTAIIAAQSKLAATKTEVKQITD